MTNVGKFYSDVIESVISDLRREFDRTDVQFLDELKGIWETKLREASVVGNDPNIYSSAHYHSLHNGGASKQAYVTLNAARNPAVFKSTDAHSTTKSDTLTAPRPLVIQQPQMIAPMGGVGLQQQPQTLAAVARDHSQTGGGTGFGTLPAVSQGQSSLQVIQLAGQTIVVPQMLLNAQGQPIIAQGGAAVRQVINNPFPNTQVDGKVSDVESDSDDGDLISEAPSSVRAPMSNMAPPTPRTRGPLSAAPGHMSSSDEDDADLVPATPLGSNTPRPGHPSKSGQGLGHSASHLDTQVATPLSVMSTESRAKPGGMTPSHGGARAATGKRLYPGGQTPRQAGGGKQRKPRAPNDSFNTANSDSEFEYEYDDEEDGPGMTPRTPRKCPPSVRSDAPLNLSKQRPMVHSDEEEIEMDEDGVPVRSAKHKSAEFADEDELGASVPPPPPGGAGSQAVGEEEEEDDESSLNSEDDVSEEDTERIFETENVVVCQYDKITRTRNKWRFHFKDGIMSIRGKDHLFQKAIGDAEW